jgi:hypothetical protein
MEESKIDGIGKIPPNIFKQAERIITRQARVMQSYVRKEHLTGGTTDTRLRARTGKLRASCIPIKTEIKEGSVEGGISFGTVYGRVHVGPKGQTTTITPKKGKYLTIPLPAAMTGAGVARGSARKGPWGETFVAKSKETGGLIIFGKRKIMSGKKAGELRGKITPLFLLLKSVRIKARVHPEELIAWIKPKMIEDFLKGGIEVG